MRRMIVVVRIGGKQYKVQEGDTLEVNRLDGAVGETLTLTDVLLTEKDGKTEVGTPNVKGITVSAKIAAQGKGKKVEVRRYKPKVRYRKQNGFRPTITTLTITAISRA